MPVVQPSWRRPSAAQAQSGGGRGACTYSSKRCRSVKFVSYSGLVIFQADVSAVRLSACQAASATVCSSAWLTSTSENMYRGCSLLWSPPVYRLALYSMATWESFRLPSSQLHRAVHTTVLHALCSWPIQSGGNQAALIVGGMCATCFCHI